MLLENPTADLADQFGNEKCLCQTRYSYVSDKCPRADPWKDDAPRGFENFSKDSDRNNGDLNRI